VLVQIHICACNAQRGLCHVQFIKETDVHQPNHKMGLFRRKTPKLSAYDEKINRSQSSRSALVTDISRSTVHHHQSNSSFTRISPAMSLPDIPIPKPPDPALNPAAYLKSIHSVRARSRVVMKKAASNSLNHFDVNMDMFQNTADYVVSIIKVCTRAILCCYPIPSAQLLAAGLCRGLSINPPPWPLAALRCRRASTNRSTTAVLA
jgi:hypothetical protein